MIDTELDYGGDMMLHRSVEQLVRDLADPNRNQQGGTPSARKLCNDIDEVCERAKRIINDRYAGSDQAILAAKLRAMTVANGCTPEEAAAAAAKLLRLKVG
jgi:hypothetical protein